eukprot:CAMPEP_0178394726 /NCGR_PEP_ID=MMETSP0689_2-20121128/12855_1 /TAXON_ID=160604 /ORGANISM="Amphidinium massartii, Strain CS-259" /LENGTH=854 /DNA_ID=CAMNT_0020015365 /DNA_START=71 /DNA_END=2635 /DNA_ORIENTATION=+
MPAIRAGARANVAHHRTESRHVSPARTLPSAWSQSGSSWRPAGGSKEVAHAATSPGQPGAELAPLEKEGVKEALNAIGADDSPRTDRRPTSPRMVRSRLTLFPSKTWDVMWQWKHDKRGYQDYPAAITRKIENAFQNGYTTVRVKSGKKGSTPMELFFFDMIQYDPRTGNHRDIRRVGPDSIYQQLGRKILRVFNRWSQTNNAHKGDFAEYKERKAELIYGHRRHMKSERECYKEKSCFASIATSGLFSFVTAFMILFNMVWLGIDTQFNDADTVQQSDWPFQVVEYFLGCYFTAELLIRFGAFRYTRDALHDWWFMFDFLLVITAGVELIVFPILDQYVFKNGVNKSGASVLRFGRLFKIARVGRTGRLLRVFPEIMVQIKAMMYAMKTVFWTLMLLFMLLYVFGIICTNLAADNGSLDEDFGNLRYSVWSLTMQGVFLDSPTDLLNRVVDEDRVLCIVFIIFICLCSFMVLNMFIGILITVVEEVSSAEKEEQAVFFLKSALTDILECHDEKGNQSLRKSEFKLLMDNPEMHDILTRFGVHVNDLKLMTDTLFEDHEFEFDVPRRGFDSMTGSMTATEGASAQEEPNSANLYDSMKSGPSERELKWDEFFSVILRFRGSNGAKVTDIVDLREYVTGGMQRQREYLSQRLEHLESCFNNFNQAQRVQSVQTLKFVDSSPDLGATNATAAGASPFGGSPTSSQLEVLMATLGEISAGQQQLISRQQQVEEDIQVWQQDLVAKQQALGRQMREVSEHISSLRRTFGDLSSDVSEGTEVQRAIGEVDGFYPVSPIAAGRQDAPKPSSASSSRKAESPHKAAGKQQAPTDSAAAASGREMPPPPMPGVPTEIHPSDH